MLALALVLVPAVDADAGTAEDEAAFVSRINGLRASQGLPALQVDGELTGLARAWAAQMADAGTISHNPSFASQVTANWRKLGENVGKGPTVDDLHQAFVDSAGHYANLVDPEFTRIGVGVVERDGMLYTSHQFMVLFEDGAAAPPPPPASTRAPGPPSTAPPAPAPMPAPPVPTPTAPLRTEESLGSLPAVLNGLRLLDDRR